MGIHGDHIIVVADLSDSLGGIAFGGDQGDFRPLFFELLQSLAEVMANFVHGLFVLRIVNHRYGGGADKKISQGNIFTKFPVSDFFHQVLRVGR